MENEQSTFARCRFVELRDLLASGGALVKLGFLRLVQDLLFFDELSSFARSGDGFTLSVTLTREAGAHDFGWPHRFRFHCWHSRGDANASAPSANLRFKSVRRDGGGGNYGGRRRCGCD
jgi:hypothetical protein